MATSGWWWELVTDLNLRKSLIANRGTWRYLLEPCQRWVRIRHVETFTHPSFFVEPAGPIPMDRQAIGRASVLRTPLTSARVLATIVLELTVR